MVAGRQLNCVFKRTIILLLLGLILQIQDGKALKKFRFIGEPTKVESIQGMKDVEDRWFEQPLDHFNEKNSVTWKQRYFLNADHYRNDTFAPIFLMIGGEAEASKKWMSSGAWIHYAEQFGALCFQLEHRFYGKSHPTNDLSTENLSYLTSEQALADLSNFVKTMKQQLNLKSTQKWIVFGGSYPGSLAAWAREKYPGLIDGAISSSGPLLAKVDFTEYFEVVKNSLNSYNAKCGEAVGKAFEQVEMMLKHQIGQKGLDEKFKTCSPLKESIENPLDVSNFFENLAGNFADVVQYNKDNSPHAKITIDEICDVMLNSSIGPQVTRLGEVNSMVLNANKEDCLDYKYEKMISEMKEVSWESKAASGNRQWTYQTCNEFGFYQTAENRSDVFGDHFGVDFFIKQCMDVYSEKMDSEYLEAVVSRTNKNYGALKPKTTNVLYVHGSIDPWHALGLYSSNDPKLPTIYIEGGAHCANMYEPLATDPSNLVKARNKIIQFLKKTLETSALEIIYGKSSSI